MNCLSLLNVLNGDMSLIGPRPERPELEHDLERHIPHYRKRHWMRPGLSGWAQVCAPYASSIEDSDLKLSYDLYYLRHFSTWLDLVILFRTIKTVLESRRAFSDKNLFLFSKWCPALVYLSQSMFMSFCSISTGILL